MNVETDVTICPKCDEAFELSTLLEDQADSESEAGDLPQLHQAPPGAWFSTDQISWQVGSTTRSAAAFFLVPFMLVWSGFSLGGIYGTQIISGKFNLGMSLFGLPFVGGTVLFGSIALMTVCGKVTVTVTDDDGLIFAGVGPFGWRRRFRWSGVRRIVEDVYSTRNAGSTGKIIRLEGETSISFASMVSEPRRYFMLHVLKRMRAGR
jgi:hypothetical protein